jgi:hypothetical protein
MIASDSEWVQMINVIYFWVLTDPNQLFPSWYKHKKNKVDYLISKGYYHQKLVNKDDYNRDMPNTVRLRYGYNTVRNSAPDNTVQYGLKTSRFYTVYCRKGSVFTAFTVHFWVVNDAVLIDLGNQVKKSLNRSNITRTYIFIVFSFIYHRFFFLLSRSNLYTNEFFNEPKRNSNKWKDNTCQQTFF